MKTTLSLTITGTTANSGDAVLVQLRRLLPGQIAVAVPWERDTAGDLHGYTLDVTSGAAAN